MIAKKPTKAEIRKRLVEAGLLPGESKPLWPAPYDKLNAESAYRFIIDCVETEEESTGEALPLPAKEYIKWFCEEWHRCLAEGQPMATVKSRRLIVTWLCTALELHASGIRAARTLVGGRVYEGNNGSRAFVRRHAFIYRRLRARFPDWKLPQATEVGNYLSGEVGKLILSNGATIEAVNSQGESFRGGGAAIVRLEELSQWPNAEIAWSQANIVVQGPPGKPGGFAYSVNNASPNEAFLALIEREGSSDGVISWAWSGTPFNVYEARSGATVIEIHYSADPEKDAKWAIETRRRLSIPMTQWLREMELDVTVHDGVPVLPEYDDAIHCPVSNSLGLCPEGVLIGGWDCGVGLVTTFVLLQIEPRTHQFQVLLAMQSAPNEAMDRFAPRVAEDMRALLGGLWHTVRHVGDPAGMARTGTTGKTAYQIAYDSARIQIGRSTNNWEDRRSAMSRALTDWVDDVTPRFVIDANRCPLLRRGLQGAYQLRTVRDETGPAAVWKTAPLKNAYSHQQDGLQYAVMMAWKMIHSLTSNHVSTRLTTPILADVPARTLRKAMLSRRSR